MKPVNSPHPDASHIAVAYIMRKYHLADDWRSRDYYCHDMYDDMLSVATAAIQQARHHADRAASPFAYKLQTGINAIKRFLGKEWKRNHRCRSLPHWDCIGDLGPACDAATMRDVLDCCRDDIDRRIVRLRAGFYSRKEIAAMLGIDAATVGRRLKRIKSELFFS